jgi:uncharacterized protein YndB with AHSA1/START domain
MTDPKTRSLEFERDIEDASPEDVWEALATSEGLRRWFPLDARVTPGPSGTVWLSWGPGCEGEAPIHVWEPGARFGWTESHGEDAEGRPIKVAVDFYVEGRDGSTVVRLVQSGISASADWDAMYDALKDGWTYFLFNLVFYFLKHRGAERRLAWKRAATDLGRDVAWERLLGAALVAGSAGDIPSTPDGEIIIDRARPVEVVSARPGHHFAATLPDLEDSVFFVELEGHHIGFWLSTYGIDDARVSELQAALDARIEVALGDG